MLTQGSSLTKVGLGRDWAGTRRQGITCTAMSVGMGVSQSPVGLITWLFALKSGQKNHPDGVYDSPIVPKILRSRCQTIIMLLSSEKKKLFSDQDIMVVGKLNVSVALVCDLVVFLPVVFQLYINYSQLYFWREDNRCVFFSSSLISP